ncbi:hypothetical protein BC941DRAFT_422028 [Chlamydoabsidia padenii]|nr:hypothetical protein BC941DRAFT_422028 [Chlamydoabsidia padenii]
MIRRCSSHLLEDDLSLDGPQTDPSAAQWNNFAAMVSKQAVTKDSPTKAPVTSPNHSTSTRNQRPLTSTVDDNHHQHYYNNRHTYKQQQKQLGHSPPQTVDLNSTSLNLFSEPPLCFCQKLASRSVSEEHGVIYDCHNMSGVLKQKMCGFHVHQQAWQRMGNQVKTKQVVDKDDPELWSCPYFNFTYCVVFRVTNQAKKASPLPPRCFCNKRTILTECDYNSKHRICFVCPLNKCNWMLWAEQVAFLRRTTPQHVTTSTDDTKAISGLLSTAGTIPQQHSSSTATSTNREQHSLCLLTALTKNKMDSLKLFDYDLPSSNTASSNNSTIDETDTMTHDHKLAYSGDGQQHEQKSIDELLYGSQSSYITTNQDLTATMMPHDTIKLIPTSVRRNTLAVKHSDEDTQQKSPTPPPPSSHVTPLPQDALWDHIHQQHILINSLQEQGAERIREMGQLQKTVFSIQQENDSLKVSLEKLKKQMQNTIDTETKLRQMDQQKVSCLEVALENLLEENTQLVAEMGKKHTVPVPIVSKCQVCYNVDVECALVPCFHAIYCMSCAHKVKICAICRVPKLSIQRVYLG